MNYSNTGYCHFDLSLFVPASGFLFLTLLFRRSLGISDILLLFQHMDRLMPAGPDTRRPA